MATFRLHRPIKFNVERDVRHDFLVAPEVDFEKYHQVVVQAIARTWGIPASVLSEAPKLEVTSDPPPVDEESSLDFFRRVMR